MRDRKAVSKKSDSIPLDAAREELHHLVQELEGLQGRLLTLRQGLPSSAGRHEDDLSADPDASTEIGRTIECVLEDRIQPAVRALLAAAEYRSGGPAEP